MNTDLKRFEIPGILQFRPGNGGLTRAVITAPQADGEVYLHGAHITHYQPRGQEHPVLFMSQKSWFEADKPIRGGVPICFPWFGSHPQDSSAPNHGTVRLREWVATKTGQHVDGSAFITLSTEADDATRRWWPADFEARLTATFGRSMEIAFEVINRGKEEIQFTEALHTYLAVGDIRWVTVAGLRGANYTGMLSDGKPIFWAADPMGFSREADGVWTNTTETCVADDPTWGRRIEVAKTGSDSTVIWNPWIEKAKKMPDFGDEEWPNMLCIETANVRANAVTLPAGKTHKMTASVRVM